MGQPEQATVVVDISTVPDGALVEVPGLGEFENGTTTKVEEAAWERYLLNNPDYDGDGTFNLTDAPQVAAVAVGDKPVTEMKKDELVVVATASGVEDASKLKVDELRERLTTEGDTDARN